MKRSDVTPELHAAAFDFLFRFARFEYALKKQGFLKSTDVGKKAEANWDRFVKRHRDRYALSTAAQALLQARPRQQVVTGKASLAWQELPFAQNEYELQKMVLLLRLLRNNLFHEGSAGGIARDDASQLTLLATAQSVLDELAESTGLMPDYQGLR